MVDVLNPSQRRRVMSSNRAKNTKPEILIRKRLHAKGFRYRLHDSFLPGKPDIVFPKLNAVVFVNGCFWHWHACRLSKLPSDNHEWWKKKFERNRDNDLKKRQELLELGWRVLTIWECGFRQTGIPKQEALDLVAETAASWLDSDETYSELGETNSGVHYGSSVVI